MVFVAVLLGLAASTGLVLTVLAILRPAPMHVSNAWHQLHTQPAGTGSRGSGLAERIATRWEHSPHGWLRLPAADLAVLELTPATLVHRCLRGAAVGLSTGLLAGLAATAVSDLAPVELAPVLVLAGLALGVLLPVRQVREHATQARHDARRGLATYLDLVAGERTAGQAPGPALSEAAALGQHWLFTRIARCLAHARRVGTTPWAALRDLGSQLAIEALTDVADLAETAADGAAVTTSLTTHAATLRSQTQSSERAAANAASERLTLPSSLMLLSLLLLVLYPTAAHLLHL